MPVTLNALRRFLRDAGCIEERVLHDPASASIFIEFRCVQKSGQTCRTMLAADREVREIGDRALARVENELASCLGLRWLERVPDEDPFG